MSDKKIHSIWVFLISSLLTMVCFHVIIGHLNTAVFSASGDGIKNLYTYLFYILYDDGLHFSGMNYPFGEHVIFTDNMPLLASIIKSINTAFPSTIPYNIGILNILLLSSFPIASVFLYKINRQFIPYDAWSIFSALFITFTAPMFIRISGHFGMAFIYYLPLIIYLLMRWHYSKQVLYIIAITIFTTVFSFIHLYNLALTMLLLGAYLIVSSIYNRKAGLKSIILQAVGPIMAIIIPMIVAQGFLKITDNITDRNGHPYGVFGGGTQGNDIFVSPYSPLGNALSFIFGKGPDWPREGYLYMGIIGFLSILTMIIIGVIGWNKYRKHKIYDTSYTLPAKSYHIWLWVGSICLLIGMGFPIQSGMYFLTDYIASLRQFRTVGRFSWIFYIFIQVYIFIFLYFGYIRLKQTSIGTTWQKVIAASVVVILMIQSTGIYFFYKYLGQENQTIIHDRFLGKIDAYDLKGFLKKNQKDIQSYQSMLFLPHYHVGSEKVWIHDEPHMLFNSMAASIQTGLPIGNVMMSRTSLQQTFDNIALENGTLANWRILEKYSDAPFLVFIDTNHYEHPRFQAWVDTSIYIGEWLQYKVYEASPQKLLAYQAKYINHILELSKELNIEKGIVSHQGNDSIFFSHSFEDMNQEGLKHKAYYPSAKIPRDTLVSFDTKHIQFQDSMYSFSAWTKVAQDDYSSPVILVEQFDKENKRLSETIHLGSKSTYVIDFWMLIEGDVKIETGVQKIQITILNDDKLINKFIAIDEILLLPKNSIYIEKFNNKVWINNRPIQLN